RAEPRAGWCSRTSPAATRVNTASGGGGGGVVRVGVGDTAAAVLDPVGEDGEPSVRPTKASAVPAPVASTTARTTATRTAADRGGSVRAWRVTRGETTFRARTTVRTVGCGRRRSNDVGRQPRERGHRRADGPGPVGRRRSARRPGGRHRGDLALGRRRTVRG